MNRTLSITGALVLGALTTYTDIRRSALCREHLPALVEAAATIGAAQIQNRGTIGGNVINASPAGDTLPVLLATDAELTDHIRSMLAKYALPDAYVFPEQIPRTSTGKFLKSKLRELYGKILMTAG
jgi:carbon-monoxide dehydrogenase medium subunit